MKFILIFLLATTSVFAQATSVQPDVEEVSATMDLTSVVKRKGFAIFRLNFKKVLSPVNNNVTTTIIAKCDDYTYMLLLTEGRDAGEDLLNIDPKSKPAPEAKSVFWEAIDKACGGSYKPPRVLTRADG